MFQHRITPFPISGTEGDLPNFNKTTTYGCCELLHLWETQYARNSKENLTLYAKGHSVFSVVSLLILPLRIKFTPGLNTRNNIGGFGRGGYDDDMP